MAALTIVIGSFATQQGNTMQHMTSIVVVDARLSWWRGSFAIFCVCARPSMHASIQQTTPPSSLLRSSLRCVAFVCCVFRSLCSFVCCEISQDSNTLRARTLPPKNVLVVQVKTDAEITWVPGEKTATTTEASAGTRLLHRVSNMYHNRDTRPMAIVG